MIDRDERSDRTADEADTELTWAWEQLVGSGDMSSAPAFEPVRGLEEHAIPSTPDSALPEDIWGDETADKGPAELAFPADSQFDDIWSLAREDDDAALDESLVLDRPRGNVEGLTLGASSVTTPDVRPAPRRPTLAPTTVPDGRRTGLPRVLGGLWAAPRVGVLALVVVATAGLLLALAARRPDTPSVSASQQIDAANLQSTSTMPASTVPRAPSTTLTTLTTLATSPPSPSIDDQAPPSTSASPSAGATAATTSVTTAAPRAPARAEATIAPVASPQEPPPGPTPTATVAPPPPPTIPVAPETTVTTRRPRLTVPEPTVAPSTTVPTPADVPPDED